MRFLRRLVIIGACWIGLALPVFAQTTDTRPYVIFLHEPTDLDTATILDPGPDGITRLEAVFQQRFNARTGRARLREPVDPTVDLIVIVRPRRPLATDKIARLWEWLTTGKSVLIALDPDGLLGTRGETVARSALNTISDQDFGLALRDGVLVEDWYALSTLDDVRALVSLGFPDPQMHPVSALHSLYDLPITTWGMRPMRSEAIGIDSSATPLFYNEPLFSETSLSIYPNAQGERQPFELNIGIDPQGRLEVAALGENSRHGGRIAIIGDAYALLNDYGMGISSTNGLPQYAGNRLLIERLGGWLLRLPEEAWATTLPGFFWLPFDGEIDGWLNLPATVSADAAGDAFSPAFDLASARGISNDSYLYLYLETQSAADANARVTIDLDALGSGRADTRVSFDTTGVRVGGIDSTNDDVTALVDPVAVGDAGMRIGTGITLRLPLRVTSLIPRVLSVCLSDGREIAFPQPPDCLDGRLQPASTAQVDPAPIRDLSLPLTQVRAVTTPSVNLRAGPSTNTNVLTALSYNTTIAVVGRTADGLWLNVQTARFRGWIASRLTHLPSETFDSLAITG